MSSVTALDLGGVEYGGTDIATCIRRSTYNNSQFIMCGYSVFDANPPYSFTKTSKSWIAKLQLTGTILTTVWVKNVDFPNYGQLIASNRVIALLMNPMLVKFLFVVKILIRQHLLKEKMVWLLHLTDLAIIYGEMLMIMRILKNLDQ
ncbi:MAG: hypothetical protein IPI30_10880 [Saprospiraceae bacterium]|nr:hypothetical protein [Candidatus Vicinibacter affinis]